MSPDTSISSRQPTPRAGLFRGEKTLSLMPTYTCPAACTSCASLSSPRERTSLSLETLLAAIAEAKELGFYNVVFTGGEATLRWRDLIRAVSYADELGFPTRLVTNAHWARSPKRATERLGELVSAGLTEINYSTGDEHVRFVPLNRVVFATIAALRLEIPVVVMVELKAERGVSADTVRAHPMLREIPERQRAGLRFIESPWMPLDPSEAERYPAGMAADRSNVASRRGCHNVLQTYTVQADGRVGACCGIGMRTIPELSPTTTDRPAFLRRAVEQAENDFLKIWIHYTGPEKVLAWAAEKDPTIDWEGRYAHHCQACARIYKDPAVGAVVREHWQEMVGQVMQSAWLDEDHIPNALRVAAQVEAVTGEGR